ncbi:MAG TPA: hypothetical protein VNT79_04515 [Phycisphaerae bacterium]|nr:hypothetical protein [Phycisphaerae bacterium]
MAQEDSFLTTEEAANKLLEAVQALDAEVKSYKSAKDELCSIREKLEGFLESSESIATDTGAIVRELRRIGGPEILTRIADLEKALQKKMLVLQTLTVLVGAIALISAVGSFLMR